MKYSTCPVATSFIIKHEEDIKELAKLQLCPLYPHKHEISRY